MMSILLNRWVMKRSYVLYAMLERMMLFSFHVNIHHAGKYFKLLLVSDKRVDNSLINSLLSLDPVSPIRCYKITSASSACLR